MTAWQSAHAPWSSIWRLLIPSLIFGLGISACSSGDDFDGDGFTAESGDCNDRDPTINPDARDVCDGIDNDCNNLVDEDAGSTTWYLDEDEDGYGTTDAATIDNCQQPKYYSDQTGDCDDSEPMANPGMAEICDGIDNDCNGERDDGLEIATWYRDQDADGYGADSPADRSCLPPEGYTRAHGDCDDGDSSVYPGAADSAGDDVDKDCGGTDAPEPNVGLSSASKASIQEAIDAAAAGTTVWVGPGTYLEHDITFAGKALSLISTDGPGATIIDAESLGRGLVFNSNEGPDSYVRGFTITGGESNRGAAVRTNKTSPVLKEMVLKGNHAAIDGGAFNSGSGAPTFRNIVVEGNTADNNGGGGFADSSSNITLEGVAFRSNVSIGGAGFYGKNITLTLNNASFEDNSTGDSGRGGGLYLITPKLFEASNCYFSGNSSANGGAMALKEGSSILENVLMMDNSANHGGGVFLDDSSPTLVNFTVIGNSAEDSGGGMYLTGALSTPTLTNSVLAFNTQWNLYNLPSDPGAPAVSYCALYTSAGSNHNLSSLGSTNLTSEPGFLAYDANGIPIDAHLALTSKLIDAGKSDVVDPDGSRSDIGAYGGPSADLWDRDMDGAYDYFWPGEFTDAPSGVDTSGFDCEDLESSVQGCL